jgi:ADP-ribosylglycohydrolase
MTVEKRASAADVRLLLARRSLLGLAIGDAFGETMFGQPQEVARRAAKRLISTKRPWRWTDDTAMALSIVEILGRHETVGDELGTGLDVAAHDTVPFCLWVAARHLDSYEQAIWTATSQDGDRDTIGAIIGGIVVLATGEDQIPFLWRAATEPVPDPLL